LPGSKRDGPMPFGNTLPVRGTAAEVALFVANSLGWHEAVFRTRRERAAGSGRRVQRFAEDESQ